ncbi:MAG: Peptidase [Solirubrobacteraceae bacterium]|nr:Peptidase [Solirubrobacteraceae bacterium]
MRIATTTSIAVLAAAGSAIPAQAGDTGGVSPSNPPHATKVSCWRGCADLSAARAGSVIRVYGSDMGQVAGVVFTGGKGKADDRGTLPSKVRSHTVYVTVPDGAVGGPLRLFNSDGSSSDPSPPVEIDAGPIRTAASGSVPPVDARIDVKRVFFDGMRPAGLTYLVEGTQAASVTVEVVRPTDQAVVARWSPAAVPAGAAQTVTWNGMDATTHTAATDGHYEFLVFTAGSAAHAAQVSAAPTVARSFEFLADEFPIRGKHQFGTGEARFGAARNGHVHQGQDTFAKCGTPLVAARGGVVKFRGFQSAAGNYLVINGQATGRDFAYMHLRYPALVKKGARVRTGQPIGWVGETGDATACHLHFEEWTAPGWYSGGHPIDPLADLKAWDRFS